jgi:rhodanese-related sulfurtransferase
MSFQGSHAFAGELSVEDAYLLLEKDSKATLVDVRTRPEWQFVGAPELGILDKSPVFLEWQVYPTMEVAADFVDRLAGELRERGVDESAPILFLCRSGVRSRQAAEAMTRLGWSRCFNIAEGFEGALDEDRHRGARSGWRAKGLPWAQT